MYNGRIEGEGVRETTNEVAVQGGQTVKRESWQKRDLLLGERECQKRGRWRCFCCDHPLWKVSLRRHGIEYLNRLIEFIIYPHNCTHSDYLFQRLKLW